MQDLFYGKDTVVDQLTTVEDCEQSIVSFDLFKDDFDNFNDQIMSSKV